jgi:hypothetical protein
MVAAVRKAADAKPKLEKLPMMIPAAEAAAKGPNSGRVRVFASRTKYIP